MKFGSRERKYIIVGLGVIMVLVLLFALTDILPGSEGLHDTVDLRKKTLLKQRETLFQEGVYESQLQVYNNRLRANMARLLPGDSPNVAGAELLKTLTDFAESSGVEITSRNSLPEEKVEDLLVKVSAQLRTRCDMDQLVRFLTEIENYNKFLTIDEFRITLSRNRRVTGMSQILTISGYINSNENKVETGDQDTN